MVMLFIILAQTQFSANVDEFKDVYSNYRKKLVEAIKLHATQQRGTPNADCSFNIREELNFLTEDNSILEAKQTQFQATVGTGGFPPERYQFEGYKHCCSFPVRVVQWGDISRRIQEENLVLAAKHFVADAKGIDLMTKLLAFSCMLFPNPEDAEIPGREKLIYCLVRRDTNCQIFDLVQLIGYSGTCFLHAFAFKAIADQFFELDCAMIVGEGHAFTVCELLGDKFIVDPVRRFIIPLIEVGARLLQKDYISSWQHVIPQSGIYSKLIDDWGFTEQRELLRGDVYVEQNYMVIGKDPHMHRFLHRTHILDTLAHDSQNYHSIEGKLQFYRKLIYMNVFRFYDLAK